MRNINSPFKMENKNYEEICSIVVTIKVPSTELSRSFNMILVKHEDGYWWFGKDSTEERRISNYFAEIEDEFKLKSCKNCINLKHDDLCSYFDEFITDPEFAKKCTKHIKNAQNILKMNMNNNELFSEARECGILGQNYNDQNLKYAIQNLISFVQKYDDAPMSSSSHLNHAVYLIFSTMSSEFTDLERLKKEGCSILTEVVTERYLLNLDIDEKLKSFIDFDTIRKLK